MSTVALTGTLNERRSFFEVWVVTIAHSLTHWYPAAAHPTPPWDRSNRAKARRPPPASAGQRQGS
jgi:hypothetical protein